MIYLILKASLIPVDLWCGILHLMAIKKGNLMGDEGYILFAILIGAYILLMPLIAFIIAKGTSNKIKRLQAEVEMLKI